jgi:hypothetical protein
MSKWKMSKVYVLRKRDTSLILMSYKTNQGNVKKAIFNDEKLAQEALDRFIKRDDLEIVAIGDELVN